MRLRGLIQKMFTFSIKKLMSVSNVGHYSTLSGQQVTQAPPRSVL